MNIVTETDFIHISKPNRMQTRLGSLTKLTNYFHTTGIATTCILYLLMYGCDWFNYVAKILSQFSCGGFIVYKYNFIIKHTRIHADQSFFNMF